MPSSLPEESPPDQPSSDPASLDQAAAPTGRRVSGLIASPWNLLLLLPLLMLVTPWFNRTDPHLGGLPFFYWYQFLFVIVGVGCVWIVYGATRRKPVDTGTPDELSVDDLDEGGMR